MGFSGGASGKEPTCQCRRCKRETWVWSLGQEDPLEEGMVTHFSILAWRIPMDRGAWWATVHWVAKSQTRLSSWTELNWSLGVEIWQNWVLTDLMEKVMTTHSSIFAWRIPMDRGAWWATVHGVTKSPRWLSTAQHIVDGVALATSLSSKQS